MRIPKMEDAQSRVKMATTIIKDAYQVPLSLKGIGRGQTYFIRTYGCQMNIHDSEVIKGILEDLGYTEVSNYEKAAIIILNTCSIRENAHNKVFGMLGRLKHLKKQKPNIMVALCGCMAQEESVITKIRNEYKWLAFVIGTHNIYELPQTLARYLETLKLTINVLSNSSIVCEGLPVKRDCSLQAWVNITYGCDNFCTYCIVPYTRGKERSREPIAIIKEVETLIKAGYKEITLLGQNVNTYGREFNYSLALLLADISKLPIKRIRFLTNHPADFTPELIKVIKANSNLMPHFHLPVQAGSNNVLKQMKRRYTREAYLKLYHNIKKEIPHASITTDIIVGFPNETEADFKETLTLIEECQFDGAFTFVYSPRVGTKAASFPDNTPLLEKQKRLQRLNQIVNTHALLSNQKLLNQTVYVLIESFNSKQQGYLVGTTETAKVVNIKGPSNLIGQIVKVKITTARTWSLEGTLI